MKEIELEQVLPQEIEKRSFEIITEELGDVKLVPGTEPVVKRCIHTSADFDYAKNLVFSDGVIEHALKVLGSGATIVTDTEMAMAGVNKRKLATLGCQIRCFMSDEAKKRGVTRAVVSMEHAAKLPGPLIFAIGNAPTALVHLYELVKSGVVKPELIIGVPVGFVNVVPSKELILTLEDVPYIVARGRKGGSNIAACICNALLYMMPGGR